jgi:hypothetical protein
MGVKLNTHLLLVPISRMVELYLHSPIYINGTVLNDLSTGTTLPYIIKMPFLNINFAP